MKRGFLRIDIHDPEAQVASELGGVDALEWRDFELARTTDAAIGFNRRGETTNGTVATLALVGALDGPFW